MLDALIDLLDSIWPLLFLVGGILSPYMLIALLLMIKSFWAFTENRDPEFLREAAKFMAIFAPLPLGLLMLLHDRHVTCARYLNEAEYRSSSYAAENMEGKLWSYNCLVYRLSRDMPKIAEDSWSGKY